jgi:hypothetical protein
MPVAGGGVFGPDAGTAAEGEGVGNGSGWN